MQATGRMAGHAGPSVFQAVAALLVATALVVGLGLAAQRLSIGGGAAATAPDDAAIQQALNAHRLGEKDALVGTGTTGGVPFDRSGFLLGEKQPLAIAPTKVVQIIPGEYRPIPAADEPDAIRPGRSHR